MNEEDFPDAALEHKTVYEAVLEEKPEIIKPGYKTTELAAVIVVSIINILVLTEVFEAGEVAKAVALAGEALTVSLYIQGRSGLKAAALKAFLTDLQTIMKQIEAENKKD